MNIEEFVNYYLQNYRHEVLLNPYNGLIEFAKVFQEKLMKEAVEYEVRDFSVEAYPHVNIPLDNKQYHSGDKVRVIVLPKNND